MIIIVEPERTAAQLLSSAVGPGAETLSGLDGVRRHLAAGLELDVLVVGPSVADEDVLALADRLRIEQPHLGVVLVRRRVDTRVLNDALRAGVRDVVAERDLTSLRDAVNRANELARRLRAQSGRAETEVPDRAGVLVTVFAAKGGSGKTTVATNLAAALADGGRREVCLVDLDLAFGDVAIALQLFPAHTIADAVPLGEQIDASAVMSLLTPHSPGLTTLVAPVEPGAAENIPADTVAAVLRVLKQQFAYVVVDTPPAFTDHVLAAFDLSDQLALLATLDIPALKNLKLTLETLDLLNYPRDRWRIVLNRADSKVGLTLSEVEKTLRMPISVQVPSSRAVPASINRGVPIVLEDPAHGVSQAIKQFAERSIVPLASAAHGGISDIPATLRTDRRGLLRRRTKSS